MRASASPRLPRLCLWHGGSKIKSFGRICAVCSWLHDCFCLAGSVGGYSWAFVPGQKPLDSGGPWWPGCFIWASHGRAVWLFAKDLEVAGLAKSGPCWSSAFGSCIRSGLVLASDTSDPVRGGILATFYSLGIGIPFLLIAAGFSWATKSVGFVKRHIRGFNIFGGSVLILIGLLMVTGLWGRIMLWIQEVSGGFQLVL